MCDGARRSRSPATIIALLALPVGTIKAAEDGVVLDEAETRYQYARVVEEPDGERKLELNEGQAVHSLYRPGSYLTGDYWDEFLVLPFAVQPRPPRAVAILGNAAGTTARALGHYFPRTRVDAVEIDPELTKLGRRWFDLRNPRMRVHHEDARPFLRRTDARYDMIMVDVYRQPYIPFYLATREFFELARDRLRPGGAVIVNVGHPEGQQELEQVLSATMATAFDTVLRDPVEDTNTMVLATSAPAAPRCCATPVCRRTCARPRVRGRPACSTARRRRGLHRRQGAGRVADRQVHRSVRCERRLTGEERKR